jgi:hypothetical protein
MLRLAVVVTACIIATAPALAQSRHSIDKLDAKFADAFHWSVDLVFSQRRP